MKSNIVQEQHFDNFSATYWQTHALIKKANNSQNVVIQEQYLKKFTLLSHSDKDNSVETSFSSLKKDLSMKFISISKSSEDHLFNVADDIFDNDNLHKLSILSNNSFS